MIILKKGSRGAEVRILQTKLQLLADGIFGSITEEAVKEFQRSKGLVADGIVGDKTWTQLNTVTTVDSSATQVVRGVVLKKSKRVINELICHCSATKEGKDFTVSDIRKWHTAPVPKGRGWSDIGYHYVIYRDGSIHIGRDVNLIGAHVTNHNSHSIGICYIGGLDENNKAKDTRTPQQKEAFIELLTALKKLYPAATIHGHSEFASKACPSFPAQLEYRNIR